MGWIKYPSAWAGTCELLFGRGRVPLAADELRFVLRCLESPGIIVPIYSVRFCTFKVVCRSRSAGNEGTRVIVNWA
jgi:hypothetical protein